MASTPDSRQDPDALLARLNEESQASARGKLRIYFGANAGVGKTYAMLAAAQRAQRAGQRVLVGVVETHDRKDTRELQAGLQVQLGSASREEQGVSARMVIGGGA